LNKNYVKAKSFLSSSPSLIEKDKLTQQIYAALFTKNLKEAEKYMSRLDSINTGLCPLCTELIVQEKHLKYKSAGLAVAMSAIIPGSGKIYTKDWKDGIIAFIMNGACMWQAYRGFHKGGISSVHGWIYAGFGFGFYSGNLYGTFKSAKRYNHRLDDKIYKKIEESFNTD